MILHPGYFPVNNWELPRGWVTKQLGELADIMQGGRLGLTKEEDYGKGQIPAYSAAGQDGQVAQAEYDRDGVVLSAIGARCGRCFFASGKWTTLANVQAILPNPARLSARYLFYRTNIEGFWPKSGSAQPFIKPSDIAKCWLAFPDSLEEQGRIVRVLDTVDAAIAKTEAVIAKLKCVRAGLLHDLLTRGLDENGQLCPQYDAVPQLYKESPLGPIPREWEICTTEELLAPVSNALRSGPFGSALLKQELVASGIPLLGIDNVHVERFVNTYVRFVSDTKFKELQKYAVRPRDVMITIMGTVGRCCVVRDDIGKALSSKHVWTITFDQARYVPELACWQMNHAPWVLAQLRRDEQGGIMTAIRSDTIRNLCFPVPTAEEQRKMLSVLKQGMDQVRSEERTLLKLQELKSGLTSDLLTGRVRVPEGAVS